MQVRLPLLSNAALQSLQLSVRAAFAATLSLVIAQFMGLASPIYAFIGAIIVTDYSPHQTQILAARRIIATIIGAALGATAAYSGLQSPWLIGLIVLLAMTLCNAINQKDAAKVAGYVCGIVMIAHTGDPWAHALSRVIETVLGIAVAYGISLVPKLVGTSPVSNSKK